MASAPTHSAQRPRLLLVLTEFAPSVGGMQTHAWYLADYLARRGYPLAVAAYHSADPDEQSSHAQMDSGLPFPVYRHLSRVGFWHNCEVIARLGRQLQVDLVYSSTVFYGHLGARLGVPVICRSVGNDVLRPWIAYPFRPGSRLVSLAPVERRLHRAFHHLRHPAWAELVFRRARADRTARAARAAAGILANSAFTADLLTGIGVRPERIEVLVGGVDAHRFDRGTSDPRAMRARLGLPADRYLIMTACRLVGKKGIDFLLEAVMPLRAAIPEVHLVVVGEGPHGARYRQMVKERGLDACVTFAGRVPHAAIHAYYWSADLFVLASRDIAHPATGVRDVETMGRVLCEANAAGVPVVAARSGGIPSVVTHRDNGLLFAPDDQADFLAQVLSIHRHPELAARLTARGREIARRRFDWSVICAAHERVFDKALGLV